MKFKLIIDKALPEEVTAVVHERSELTDKIEALVLQYEGSDTIAAFTEDDMRMLPYGQIECFTVLDGKTVAIDRKGIHYRVKQRLYELELMLPHEDFIRISKSQIVNINKIRSLKPEINRTILATMCNGELLYISRKYVKAFKSLLSI